MQNRKWADENWNHFTDAEDSEFKTLPIYYYAPLSTVLIKFIFKAFIFFPEKIQFQFSKLKETAHRQCFQLKLNFLCFISRQVIYKIFNKIEIVQSSEHHCSKFWISANSTQAATFFEVCTSRMMCAWELTTYNLKKNINSKYSLSQVFTEKILIGNCTIAAAY